MFTAVLVTAAAMLFESAPFILAATLLTRVPLRWGARIDAYLGCGCGVGPSARSLPAAAATLLLFGPLVAGARLACAIGVAALQRKRHGCMHDRSSLLSDLWLIAPLAGLAAIVSLLLPALGLWHMSPPLTFLAGATSAFVMAPCALGAVGLAATLRTLQPAAAAGFLCVAGIADLRVWMRRREAYAGHDALAYALLGLACVIVATHHGSGLLNPKLAYALWPCAIAALRLAYRYRGSNAPVLRIAPAIMLAGAVLGAPLPQYHATETTIADAFAGEQLDFTGVLTRTHGAAALVRFAITCCRADAAPIVVRLLQTPAPTLHGWLHARGVLVARGSTLQLRAHSLAPVDAPVDPFVYR